MKTKIVNPTWEHKIEFKDGSTTLLIIENSEVFRNYLQDLRNQSNGDEGNFVLSDEKEELSFKDRFSITLNPLLLEINDKRIQTKINALMKNHMSNDSHFNGLTTLISRLEAFAQELEEDFPFEVEHAEPDLQSIQKILNFTIKTDYQNEIEKLIEYTNILHDVCNIDHFAFVGLFDYFNASTIETFIKECNANKHNLLLIERYNQTIKNPQQKILIDQDLCEIFE